MAQSPDDAPPRATETQPAPNLSTEPDKDSTSKPSSDAQPRPTLSTEHQESGDALRPSDTLDRGQPGGGGSIDRKTSLTGND